MENENKYLTYHSGWLTGFLWKNRWMLIIAGLAGGIIAYIATLFLPEEYKSTAVVYAAGYDQNNEMVMKEGNALLLLAFLESSWLRDSAIKEFDLAVHYGIDTSTAEGRAQLEKSFTNNTSFVRTVNRSIQVNVKDKDPEFAADLANGIVRICNNTKQDILKRSTSASLETIKHNYAAKKKEVDSLATQVMVMKESTAGKELAQLQEELTNREHRINQVRQELKNIREKFQIHDLNKYIDHVQALYTESNAHYLTQKGRLETYSKNLPPDDTIRIRSTAEAEGLSRKVEHLKKNLDNVSDYGNVYNDLNNELALQISLRDNLEWRISAITSTIEPQVNSFQIINLNEMHKAELQRLNELKKKYEEAMTVFDQRKPAAYLISPAKANYEPAYPKTLLITFASMLLMFLFVLIILLIKDQIIGVRT